MPLPRVRAHGLARLAILLSLVGSIGTSSATVQPRVIAFTSVTLIDGTDAAPRADLTVVIEGNQVSAIGRTGTVRVPADAQRVDGRAKFLIPGLWDMHVHLGAYDDAAKALPRLVAHGITGVRDMASPVDDIVRLRRESASGTLLGPQILAAGPILQRPLPFRLPPFVRTVTDPDARSVVDELHGNGVDFIKVGDTLTRDAYFAIAEQSTRRGLPFAGHLPVSVSAAEAAQAGQRSIEHFGSAGFRGVLLACSRDEARLTEVVRDALITALAGGPSPEEKLYRAEFLNALVDSYDGRKAATLFELFTTKRTWQEPTLVALRSVWEQQRTRLSSVDAAAGDRIWSKTLEMFADMREHGVKILAGSDVPVGSGVPPLHDELVALVRSGMTPLQALQAATRNAADFRGRLATEGTVEVGKKANLVLLEADPLRDIANTRRVAAVVVGGRFVSESELQKIR